MLSMRVNTTDQGKSTARPSISEFAKLPNRINDVVIVAPMAIQSAIRQKLILYRRV